jgi:hypothetical protein
MGKCPDIDSISLLTSPLVINIFRFVGQISLVNITVNLLCLYAVQI